MAQSNAQKGYAMPVYQMVVRSVAARHRKLEAASAKNRMYQIISFGTGTRAAVNEDENHNKNQPCSRYPRAREFEDAQEKHLYLDTMTSIPLDRYIQLYKRSIPQR